MTTSIEFVGGKFVGKLNNQVIVRSTSKYYVQKKLEGASSVPAAVESSPEESQNEFPINQRFGFVTDLVTMVATKATPSTIITGEGGLGKTYTVLESLRAAGLKDISEFEVGAVVATGKSFRVVKGYSTAKGLYRTLYENSNSILVFDDCDSILRDPEALNILKGALDSFDKRYISWNTSRDSEDLPRSFCFNGGVIFISNMPMHKIDQAIRSRSMCVDLSMTVEQKLERMDVIIESIDFLPHVELLMKREALSCVREFKSKAREISLRTLISVAKIRATDKGNWKDLAQYMLLQG